MRLSMGSAAGVAVLICLAGSTHAQQIQQAPLSAPAATGIGVPAPDTAYSPPAPGERPSPPQIAQTAPAPTTQDCVAMPTPVEQTDCLNQLSSEGNYMPTPAPAPGSQMPMAYRLPLGKRLTGPNP